METPRWTLENVFPGIDSPELERAITALERAVAGVERYLKNTVEPSRATDPDLPARVGQLVRKLNDVATRDGTIRAYVASFTRTDSYDQRARKIESELDGLAVRWRTATSRVTRFLGKVGGRIDRIARADKSAATHVFYLRTSAEQARYLLSDAEESLAAELGPSGGEAWSRLQRVVTSQLTVELEVDGETKRRPMPEVINLRSHPDEATRRRGWEAENAAWATVKEPLAAAMNGIKGESGTLSRRRGRTDALHASLDMARIDRDTLEAMLAAMKDSFPVFRRYFRSKAARLGKEKLAWWDLYAPLGAAERTLSFPEARDFILGNFGGFAPELEALARRAFDERWIDAEMRSGKVGGAFCMEIPATRESRILCNYDGSLDQVTTLAHELGHAFHNECAFAAGKTALQRDTPMTLAETASILCETIVSEAVLAAARTPQEELAVRETTLNGSAQVIVDIYSRYLFEKEVFERRERSALTAEELCAIMDRAQAETYGDGLDERYRQPWMWTWKPHYYSPDLAFYNYPYAFGLLLALGLYAIYKTRGAAFVTDYRAFLASTGEADAAELAARFGIDIRDRAFWDGGLKIIGGQIDRYCEI